MANDTFELPREGSSFTTSDVIRFAVDELTDERENKLKAILFELPQGESSHDNVGYPIKTIGLWNAELNTGDIFEFDWRVDVRAGRYTVCAYEIDLDGHNSDDEDDIDFDDYDSCSYPFIITGGNGYRKKRSIYSA